MHAFDRQTDGQNSHRVCIACSAVKTLILWLLFQYKGFSFEREGVFSTLLCFVRRVFCVCAIRIARQRPARRGQLKGGRRMAEVQPATLSSIIIARKCLPKNLELAISSPKCCVQRIISFAVSNK